MQKRCPIIFQSHPSNFKVTRAEKSMIESNLSKITRPVAAIKSLRFALLSVSNYMECINFLLEHDEKHNFNMLTKKILLIE